MLHYFPTRIGGVMVSVFTSSVVEVWFEPLSDKNQRLYNWYLS
jgi:hypothetical protein